MIEEIKKYREEASAAIEAASSLVELETAERSHLGKAAPLQGLKKSFGSLPPEDRKTTGMALKEANVSLAAQLANKKADYEKAERAKQLESERLDLTENTEALRVGRSHIITQAMQELEDTFVGMGFNVAEGPEVETDWHNFDALNIPVGHPARDGFDSLFVDYGAPGSTLLRTHTSPVQIRTMLEQKPPIYVITPGRVYRRDTADATHMPVFHQLECLVIDKDISMAHLAGTIEAFTTSYFGDGFTSRLRPNYFPFTEPSAEFDIQRPDGSWLELGGCGMVHPNVLKAGGIDSEEWSGFAFGFGIDRLASLKFGVTDLREMFSNDSRFLAQF